MPVPGRRSRPRGRTRSRCVELPLRLREARRRSAPRPRCPGRAAAAPAPPARAAEQDQHRLGHPLADLPAPWTSISRSTSCPAVELRVRRGARACRSGAPKTSAHSSSSPAVDHPVELARRRRSVVDAVDLAGPRRTGGGGDGEHAASGSRAGAPRTTVPLPTPEGPAMTKSLPRRVASAALLLRTSSSSCSRCLAPRPRTRRLAEMSSSSMIFCARTLPTPGSDSSTVDTFILPTVSSPDLASTSFSERLPDFSSPLSSARFLRASAAFCEGLCAVPGSGWVEPSRAPFARRGVENAGSIRTRLRERHNASTAPATCGFACGRRAASARRRGGCRARRPTGIVRRR